MPVITALTLQRFYSTDGKLLAGGRLYTYEAGTNTPKAIYKDSLGLVKHTNPVSLNARGEVIAGWVGSYKIVLRDRFGVIVATIDNAQWSYGVGLTPLTIQKFYSNSGALLNGGKLYTYQAGTDSPKAIYQDSLGTLPHANPVVIGSSGEVTAAWIGLYKIVLKDKFGATIAAVDNAQGAAFFVTSSAQTIDLEDSTPVQLEDGANLLLE